MKPVTLYKKGCDPYVVNSNEELIFHKNQGWVDDPDKVEQDTTVILPPKPYIVGETSEEPVAPATDSDAAAKIKELEEIVAAKEATISEMQSDFEDVVAGMNDTIAQLKDQLNVLGMTPVTDVPKAARATSRKR